MSSRTREENKELDYDVRLNGRIMAAFRHRSYAEYFVRTLSEQHPDKTVECRSDGFTLFKLNPR